MSEIFKPEVSTENEPNVPPEASLVFRGFDDFIFGLPLGVGTDEPKSVEQ